VTAIKGNAPDMGRGLGSFLDFYVSVPVASPARGEKRIGV